MIHPLQAAVARARNEERARRTRRRGAEERAAGPAASIRYTTRIAVVAVLLLVSLATVGTTVALADHGRDRGGVDVTFTKWVTSLPADPSTLAGAPMAGVVGGDVGRGRYAGLVLSDDTASRPGFWLAHALYGVFGRDHAFVADLHITEDDTTVPITATIRGVVIWGWRMGARVTGEYRIVDSCPIPTPGNVFAPTCVVGTLHLRGGSAG